jgi:hypothetical protein
MATAVHIRINVEMTRVAERLVGPEQRGMFLILNGGEGC